MQLRPLQAKLGRYWLLVGTVLLVLHTGCGKSGTGGIAAVESSAARAQPPADAKADAQKDVPLKHPFSQRQKAPSLDGGLAWINTSGPLDLKQLRGKFVVLDFWTYCCINCIHVLPVLKQLEHAYPNEIVVIGVHSAKFQTEQDSQNIKEAVLRYEIEHPVVNDAEHRIWQRYFVQSWPSLRIIDPEGNLVAGHSGEIEFDKLNDFFKEVLPYYRQAKLLDTTPVRFDLAAYDAARTPLRFPGKLLADEAGGRLFIADSNHNRIVVAGLDGALRAVIGSGQIGAVDGDYRKASFDHPQGMALRGQTLYVADTENHLLRKVDLAAKRVSTIAGTGAQARGWPGMDDVTGLVAKERPAGGKLRSTGLNSPWDLWIHGSDLYLAMAGPHQIWKMALDESSLGPYAGNGAEDIIDGALLPPSPYQFGYASFAQPSGLSSDGHSLFVADSEGSSIRSVPFEADGKVRTLIGTAHLPEGRLFTFGDVDGTGGEVRLQHALGVAWHQGSLYIADTYNNKIKVLDPVKRTCKTIAGTGKPGDSDNPATFDEPAGLSIAGNKLYVADTNNHRIRVIDLAGKARVSTLTIGGLEPPAAPQRERKPNFAGAPQVKVPEVAVKPQRGNLLLKVQLNLPSGYKINPLAPLRYLVEGMPAQELFAADAYGRLIDVPERKPSFDIRLPLARPSGQETLRVSLAYYYCQDGSGGLCKAGSVAWTVPVKLGGAGVEHVALAHDVR